MITSKWEPPVTPLNQTLLSSAVLSTCANDRLERKTNKRRLGESESVGTS